jgi:ribosome biogenesis SPOUT family RNA methylase Rps3
MACPKVPLDKIPYVDNPELRINKNESTEMPFRYVKGENGQPIMPDVGNLQYYTARMATDRVMQGMVELIKKDSEKGFGDLF